MSRLVQDWTSGAGGTQVMLPPSPVAGGEYVLEIAGLESGTASGTYIGALDIAPVPLPAALPLLVSVLGGLGLFRRRRSLAAAQWLTRRAPQRRQSRRRTFVSGQIR